MKISQSTHTLIAIVLLVLFAGGGYWFWHANKTASSAAPEYSWATATRQDLTETWQENGTVTSDRMAELAFDRTGKLTYVRAARGGDVVPKGALLARIDPNEALENWQATQSQVEAARAKRSGDQVHDQSASARTVDNETVRALKHTAAALQTEVGKTTLTAPFTGVLLSQNAAVGEVATAGQPVMALADPATLHFTVPLAQTVLMLAKPGTPVEVTFDTLGSKKTVIGTLERVELMPSTVVASESLAQPEEQYQAVVALSSADDQLKIGMTGSATFSFPVTENVLTVPQKSLFAEGDQQFVILDKGQGQTEKRFIKTGRVTSDRVEVTQGLAEGDRVAQF